ncbi:MAG: hypothetical protein ACREPR_04820 [Brasilonema sp.]
MGARLRVFLTRDQDKALLHLKKDELAGKMFDDELELAYVVIDGFQARGQRGNYSTQRVKFNSNSFA